MQTPTPWMQTPLDTDPPPLEADTLEAVHPLEADPMSHVTLYMLGSQPPLPPPPPPVNRMHTGVKTLPSPTSFAGSNNRFSLQSGCIHLCSAHSILQWQIQDSPEGDANSRSGCVWPIFLQFFSSKNCMKMKEFEPRGGRIPGVPLGSADALHLARPFCTPWENPITLTSSLHRRRHVQKWLQPVIAWCHLENPGSATGDFMQGKIQPMQGDFTRGEIQPTQGDFTRVI